MPREPIRIADRFRTWYAYERDCNARCLQMLNSVPAAVRGGPQFSRAVGKLAHLVAARHMWLARLGVSPDRPAGWFPDTTLEALPAVFADIEQRWASYLSVSATTRSWPTPPWSRRRGTDTAGR